MNKKLLPFLSGVGRGLHHDFLSKWCFLPILIYLAFILPIYFENNAGSGLNMPQNIIAWSAMALCILFVILKMAITGWFYTGRFMLIAVLAVILLMLPILWTPNPLWQFHALPRLVGIASALIFFIALCQTKMTSGLRRLVLLVVLLSAEVQAVEAMVQAWLPDVALRLMEFKAFFPYGIFQQRNLLASWLATGYGVALYLALNTRIRIRAFCFALSLFPLTAALMLSQSRTGALGAVIMTALSALIDIPRLRGRSLAVLLRVMLASSLVAWCMAISLWGTSSQADFQHIASTKQRLQQLAGTVEMIKKHPLLGSGLGSFESQLPEVMEVAGIHSFESDTVTHPHNEVLYVMSEGGIIALVGLLLLAGIWLWPAFHYASQRKGQWLLALTSLPIVIHMMTEYPLYLSTPHLLLLLLLFRAGLPDMAMGRSSMPVWVRVTTIPAICLCMVAVLTILAAGFSTQLKLTMAEEDMNGGLIPSLPISDWRSLTHSERLDYDRHMLAANTPGFTRNYEAMAEFTEWGNRWLSVHNNSEVSAALQFIANRRGDKEEAERIRSQAARVFVHDTRFIRERE